MQKPEATRVAGFKAWLAIGYCVRRGEKALRIFAKPALLRLMRSRSVASSVPREDARVEARLRVERKSSGVCGLGS
jgi:hypothetical protein